MSDNQLIIEQVYDLEAERKMDPLCSAALFASFAAPVRLV